MAEVLVTGGTGALGSELVPLLIAKGYGVRILSRRARPNVPVGARAVQGDLVTGAGLEDAAIEVDILVRCASGTGTARSLTYRSALRTDVEATRRLLDIAKQTGEPYVVYISIVGVDRIPLGYYRGKFETEGVIASSGLPYTVLRTTQWHSLAWELCRRLSRAPVMPAIKGLKVQLLDPGEVAVRMLELVESGPMESANDMGGPEILEMREVVQTYLDATRRRRAVLTVPFPGRVIDAYRAGHNLTPEHADGTVTWEQWLRERSGAGAAI